MMSKLSPFFIGGLIVGIIVAVLIVKTCNQNNKFKTEYDERQAAIRGKSYMYGFWTMGALLGLLTILNICGINLPMENSILYFSVLLISFLVQITHAIWNDAYFGLNNNWKKYSLTFFLATFINLFVAIMAGIHGELIEDGMLTFRFLNGECAFMFIVIGAVYVIKGLVQKNKAEEEEDEES